MAEPTECTRPRQIDRKPSTNRRWERARQVARVDRRPTRRDRLLLAL